jgi:RNA polymerase sigma factor (sigma-70 family)
MTTTYDDAQLVATHLAGDPAALAGIYDRFADSLYDTAAAMLGDRHDAADIVQDVFVIAAERLDQLRDPTRLKPWLFAIMRNEVYRRTKQRRRVVATDFSESGVDMSAPPDQGSEGASAEYEELAELVRDAARGLDARDQLVLELSLRQGLQGADLADALGVSAQQSYGLVHRMRDRTERSLGALCVARAGRKECPELDEILRAWNGQFSVLIRKRVARHIDECETCERTKRRFAPLVLLGSAKAMAAPIDLRDRVLSRTTIASGDTPPYAFTRPGGFPTVARRARRLAAMLGLAVIAVLVLGGTAAFVIAEGDQPDVIATADGAPVATGADVLGAPDPTVGGPEGTIEQVTTGTGSIATATDGETVTTASVTTTSGPDESTTTTTTTQVASAAVVPPIPSDPPSSSDAPTPLPPTEPTTTDATPTTTEPTTEPTTAPPTTAPPTTSPPALGTLTLDATTVDLGASDRSRTVTLGNHGGRPVSFVVTVGSPFSLTAPGSVLAPGESMALTISVDRSPPTPEGPFGATAMLVPVETGVASASMNLLATVERPPVVVVDRPPEAGYCPLRVNSITVSVLATVTDESPPLDVIFRATHEGGASYQTELKQGGASWSGSLQLPPLTGVWQWIVEATDARRNAGSQGGKFAFGVDYC